MNIKFKEAFNGFGGELIGGIRNKQEERIHDAVFEETIAGIEKATAAMIEAGVDKNLVVKMLQKYWNLRGSEATAFVENSKPLD